MTSGEDQLPPKQRLPRTFRECVGNDTKARSHCPINGTRPFDLVKCRDRRERDHEKKRQAQAQIRRVEAASLGRQTTMELGAQGTKGIEGPTIVYPSTAVPGAECFHSWSIHDSAAPALQVNHHFATTPTLARTVQACQPSGPLPATTTAQEQHIPEHNVIQFQSLDLGATATSSARPRSIYIVDNTFPANAAITSPDLETRYNPSTGSSMLSPTVKFEDSQGSAATPSPHVTPNHNPASPAGQGSIWSEDEFIAAYQAFFLPHPIKDSSSPAQALGPIHHDLDTTTVQRANGDPALEDRATKHAHTDATTATVSYVSQTWLENGDLVDWTLRLMPIAPVDPQQSEALKIAAAAGYAHTLRLQGSLISSVPEEVYAAMRPSPPAVQSSYSELAHGWECPLYAFATNSARSSARGSATRMRPAIPGTGPTASCFPLQRGTQLFFVILPILITVSTVEHT